MSLNSFFITTRLDLRSPKSSNSLKPAIVTREKKIVGGPWYFPFFENIARIGYFSFIVDNYRKHDILYTYNPLFAEIDGVKVAS